MTRYRRIGAPPTRKQRVVQILRKTPVVLLVFIAAVLIASVQGGAQWVFLAAILYGGFVIGAVALMTILLMVFGSEVKTMPRSVAGIVVILCLSWSLSLIIWFFSIGHLIDFFNPNKRRWVNYGVRKRVRRFWQRR